MIALLMALRSTLGGQMEHIEGALVELPEFRLVDNLSDSLKADSFNFPVGIPNAKGERPLSLSLLILRNDLTKYFFGSGSELSSKRRETHCLNWIMLDEASTRSTPVSS